MGAWGAGPRRLRAGFAVIYNTFELENERWQGQGQQTQHPVKQVFQIQANSFFPFVLISLGPASSSGAHGGSRMDVGGSIAINI